MNGRASKMLRKMRSGDREGKRLWQAMTPDIRGMVRKHFRTNPKLMHFSLEHTLEILAGADQAPQ